MKFSGLKQPMKPFQIVYPLVLFLVFVVTGIAIFKTMVFFKDVVDAMFPDQNYYSSQLVSVNIADYRSVAEKLGVKQNEAVIKPQPIIVTSTPATTTINKAEIKVVVYNASDRSGIAGEMVDQLKAAGFVNAVPADSETDFEFSSFGIKAAYAQFAGEIRAILEKQYKVSEEVLLAEDRSDDVSIFLGNK